jgi:pimeloyl-ACP methyl ester carboxylesterase
MIRRSLGNNARRAVLSLSSLVALSLLAGCASLFGPTAPSTSTPTGENVSAELEPFYEQILQWSDCGGGMQCTEATAPLSWKEPAKGSIRLALIRQPAFGGAPLGSLLVNPGGPGGSGYEIVKDNIDFVATTTLQKSYDIVGLDPRGVGLSSSIACHTDASTLDNFLYDITPGAIGSDSWFDAVGVSNAAFAADCQRLTGDLLGQVDTTSAARDLDLLRAVLGDSRLNYLGFSYGTFLGATYAQLYPTKTGRMVLDGAIDPSVSSYQVTATQAMGFESALRAFLVDCRTQSDCPFRGSPAAAQKQIRAMLERLDASPIRHVDGRMLGSTTMTTAIILPLYDAANWHYLRELFTAVASGDAELAFSLADSYNGRDANGEYLDNSLEARIAINCLDYPSEGTREQWREDAAALEGADEVALLMGGRPDLEKRGEGCLLPPPLRHPDPSLPPPRAPRRGAARRT